MAELESLGEKLGNGFDFQQKKLNRQFSVEAAVARQMADRLPQSGLAVRIGIRHQQRAVHQLNIGWRFHCVHQLLQGCRQLLLEGKFILAQCREEQLLKRRK